MTMLPRPMSKKEQAKGDSDVTRYPLRLPYNATFASNYLLCSHVTSSYDGVQSLTVLEPKIKVRWLPSSTLQLVFQSCEQVDLTKYTEQHEFYFDEVSGRVMRR
jgi:hypothetical protein